VLYLYPFIMHFTFAVIALSLLGLGVSTVDAACHKVSRRALAARNEQPAAPRLAAFQRTSSSKQVVRRQKGGARLNRQGESWGGAGSAARASMTAPAGDSGSGAPSAAAWTKSSSQTSKAAQATGGAWTASSSSSAAASTSTSSSASSSSGSTYSGVATFFYRASTLAHSLSLPGHALTLCLAEDGNAGACGSTHSDSDKIVALQTSMYGSGSYCGKTVVITNTSNGKSVTATVADGASLLSPSQALARVEADIAGFLFVGRRMPRLLVVRVSRPFDGRVRLDRGRGHRRAVHLVVLLGAHEPLFSPFLSRSC